MPESEAKRYIEGLIAQLNAAGKSASAYSAQNALNNGDYVGAERYATGALGFQAILPNVGVTPSASPTPSTGVGRLPVESESDASRRAQKAREDAAGGASQLKAIETALNRSLTIPELQYASSVFAQILDSLGTGAEAIAAIRLAANTPEPSPSIEDIQRHYGTDGLPGGVGAGNDKDAELNTGGALTGAIIGADDQGNIWTQADLGDYYRNGQTVDIRDPNVRASLTQAQKNGPTGVGSGDGSGQSAGSAESQRLQNALLQRELDSNPNLQVGFDSTTGRSFLIDTQTGKRTDVGQTDFASIDPARQFQEDTRQFDTTNDRLGQTAANQNELGRFSGLTNLAGEDRLRQSLALQAQVSQGELNLGGAQEDRLRQALGLQAQQANGEFAFAGAQEDRLRQALGLDRGVAQAGINQGLANTDTQRAQLGQNADVSNQGADQFRFEQLRQILSNPSDFLARAFMQRGEQSPSGQVTQADLINALRTEIRDVQAPQYDLGVQDLYNQGQLDPLSYTTGVPNVQLDNPQYETAIPQQQITAPQYDISTSDIYNNLNNLDLSYKAPPPAASPQPDPAPMVDADRSRLLSQLDPNVAGSVDSTVPNSFLQQLAAIKQRQDADRLAQQTRLAGASTPTVAPTTSYVAPAPTSTTDPYAYASGGRTRFAEGGATRLPMFITGDRVDGVPTGNEEMILNPEKAPIKVIPNPNNVPHMARGTETETDQLFRLMGLLPRPEQLQRLIERLKQLKLQKKSADQGGLLFNESVQLDTSQIDDQRGPRWWERLGFPPPVGYSDTIDPSRTQGRGPGGAPRFALGTLAGTVTQDQVNQYAQDFSPPAVNNLFNGGQEQNDLRFGFSLFTPQQLQQLTGDEQQALNARLGAQFNTTLDDVVKSQSQRFGATRQRQRGRFQL